MDIPNPRRILAVSLEDSAQHLSRVIQDLTGTPPEPTGAGGSLAGTTHPLRLSTAYYAAEVPVWLDLVASPPEWAASFLSPEAREVLDVLGGLVVVFELPGRGRRPAASPPPAPPPAPGETAEKQQRQQGAPARALLAQVGRVVKEGLGGWGWDGVGLAVGVGDEADAAELDLWEEACAEGGLEFVHLSSSSSPGRGADERNEFGEKVGMPRVLEALESNDWAQGPGRSDGLGGPGVVGEGSEDGPQGGHGGDREDEAGDAELDPESLGFGLDGDDPAGLGAALWSAGEEGGEEQEVPGDKGTGAKRPPPPRDIAGEGEGEADDDDEQLGSEDVEKVERMMRKLRAVRDGGAGLPEAQRRRMAARAVGEVMREL